MRSEYSANQILVLESRKKKLEKMIRNHVGIVPQEWYDELNRVEMKLLKVK